MDSKKTQENQGFPTNPEKTVGGRSSVGQNAALSRQRPRVRVPSTPPSFADGISIENFVTKKGHGDVAFSFAVRNVRL